MKRSWGSGLFGVVIAGSYLIEKVFNISPEPKPIPVIAPCPNDPANKFNWP